MKTEWNDNVQDESLTLKEYLEQARMSPTLKHFQKAVLTVTASDWNLPPRTDPLNANPTEA